MMIEMAGDPGAVVSAAAIRTMRGSARVTLTGRVSVPEYDGDNEYVGIVDFGSDRCRLDPAASGGEGAKAPMMCDGSVLYMRQQNGRWTWTTGAPGTHNMFDPRWSLEALVHARVSADAAGPLGVELKLDYDALNAGTDIGLSPDWNESTAVVQLSAEGRIARVILTHHSRGHPEAWMRFDHEISERGPAFTIDLPRPELTISLERYLEQQHDSPHL